jgi:hypothetical protein
MVNLFPQIPTMVSFMHYCKKFSLFFGLLFFCLQSLANPSSIVIKSAELTPEGEVYKLNADLEIELDEKIKEAINKGVSVEFLYTFELVSPRSFWFDKEIVSTSTSISVSYHALSRQYLVSQSGRQTSHEILSEAMIELIQLYDWKVLDKTMVESNREYKASLRVKLDQTKLPKAIQVEAIGSEDWQLASDKFEWMPKDLNH